MSVAPLENELHLGNDAFYEMLDSLATNVLYADGDLNLRYMNEKSKYTLSSISGTLREEFNLTVEELIGTNLDVLHKARKDEIRKILANPRNFPYNAEIRLGELILDLNINAVFDKNNQIKGYILNWEEITEKKKLELAASRAESMVDQSPVNTMMCDTDRVMLYMNKNSLDTLRPLESLLPCKADELVGKSIDILHKNPDHQKRLLADPNNLPHKAIITLGEHKLDLLVSGVFDAEGNYVGSMVNWQLITDKLRLIDNLKDSSQRLSASSKQLTDTANSMAASAEETTAQATTASAASEEVTQGIATVATNMEEMSASIKEITNSTNKASETAQNAKSLANSTNDIISKLGDSSLEIGNVIKVISSIAQQTNLLALNATIEAARAGEAGKGFAVVANEVKELAKQTASATEDITQKIETIQGDAKSAVDAIGEIQESIESVNEMTGTIATAVEQQSASTNEVARIVQESADAVKSINSNINQVSEAAAEAGKGASQTQESASDLQDMANGLEKLVKDIDV